MEKIEDFQYTLDVSAIVAITDHRGVINHVNENFCRISKYSPEELIGKDHRVINSGFHDKEFFLDLWSTISKGKVWKGEIKNRAKDGTYYWVDTTIVPFLDAEGKPYKYVAIRNDITERKLGEERLKNSLKELSDYKYALDESAIVAITDQKGFIKHVNDNFCKISKYSRSELIGQDHRIINSGFHPKSFIRDLWVTISHGKVWKGELRNQAKDGTFYWVDTTIVPFLNEARKPYQYLAIRSDITERKQAEEALRISKNKAVENAKALENKNKQLVDFCNIVSHNLRAPLVNISMLVDYLESSEDEVERQEIQDKIKPVINHLMEVFNELVESIQVQQDKDIELDDIDLHQMLRKVLLGFSFQLTELKADVHVDIEEAPKIRFPHRYMESILTNLISNSLKYRSPQRKPIIRIRTIKKANKIVLSVKDNGLGINMDLHKKHMFKIRKTFHKHKDAKGFGLFMTKSQVEAMGGKIWVDSQPDLGATFFVEIDNNKL
ncbi:PAS domain-containing sensor histidine kinase [Pleomorphovibrio marinus]|uniref:PAS domain-containing sensor histidine kinase n=1 Tax=Pleomorphovibrio marinus TaxID=2164132 RepID=UPI000E0B0344|nr:PAS domain-containing sensor histidine kinase [Pleomorphovibrio marinus]